MGSTRGRRRWRARMCQGTRPATRGRTRARTAASSAPGRGGEAARGARPREPRGEAARRADLRPGREVPARGVVVDRVHVRRLGHRRRLQGARDARGEPTLRAPPLTDAQGSAPNRRSGLRPKPTLRAPPQTDAQGSAPNRRSSFPAASTRAGRAPSSFPRLKSSEELAVGVSTAAPAVHCPRGDCAWSERRLWELLIG